MTPRGARPDPQRPALAVGNAYAATLDAIARGRGAHYTGYDDAATVVGMALRTWEAGGGRGLPRVLDPACGGGAFLVAAADALVARGADPSAVAAALAGIDVDPGACAAASAAVRAWGEEHGIECSPRIVCADSLQVATPWPEGDLVVGNPPFQAQTRVRSRRDAAERVRQRAAVGDAAAPLVDTAALFLLRAVEGQGRGGVTAMILPRSVMATRDAAECRRRIGARATMEALWSPRHRLFHEAAVGVVVPVFRAGAAGPWQVALEAAPPDAPDRAGLDAERVAAGEWSGLLADAEGVPAEPPHPGSRCLGDVARATAGHRDLFYAVAGGVVEHDGAADPDWRVATTAMIDPGVLDWAHRTVKVAGRRLRRPVVRHAHLAAVAPRVAAWAGALRRPKALVATQSRVLEVAADGSGDVLPLTPVIAVVPHDGDPWALVAALSAPPATVWAYRRAAGAARSSSALKLSARQVLELPLPADGRRWARAAAALRAGATVVDVAEEMDRAWNGDGTGTLSWWAGRLP